MDPTALETAVASDVQAGLRPMVIVATAGTTDTGEVDPLGRCADVAAAHGAWLHVDAAYGGFFQLTDRGQARLDGIERADSITVDAHKSLLLPFGIGGLIVRDVAHLVDAHEGRGAYMHDVADGELPHYLSLGPELTRPNRGLPMWLALNLHGVDAFRRTLDSMLDLAAAAAARLRELPTVELFAEPRLSILAFRSTDGDEATARLQQTLNESGRVHVSSTTIAGRLWVRLAFLSQRTTAAIVDETLDLIASAVTARAG
jgi:aromatic-L-amino-acid decarboxylase